MFINHLKGLYWIVIFHRMTLHWSNAFVLQSTPRSTSTSSTSTSSRNIGGIRTNVPWTTSMCVSALTERQMQVCFVCTSKMNVIDSLKYTLSIYLSHFSKTTNLINTYLDSSFGKMSKVCLYVFRIPLNLLTPFHIVSLIHHSIF